ncbi:hypothetical protein I4U23_015292 [Adineta vaga]|nr:hypothetical protein I4U23_015292 [Adineta vaga]
MSTQTFCTDFNAGLDVAPVDLTLFIAVSLPIVYKEVALQHVHVVQMSDFDGTDILKCRWPVGSTANVNDVDECANTCTGVPDANRIQTNCTIVKFVTLETLVKHVKAFRCRWLRNTSRDFLSMSILKTRDIGIERSCTDINGTFLFSQLLLDILLQLDPPFSDKDKFVSKCAELCKGLEQQTKDLKDFNINYRKEDALEWYMKNTFIFELLNRALRLQNISFLFLFCFFIRDLQNELKNHQCLSPVHVYRGQLMSKIELAHLEQSHGKFIAMNSFVSTSLQRHIALHFLGITEGAVQPPPDGFEYVLLEIDANPNVENGGSTCANVGDIGEFDEEEVLFPLSSVFRLDSIRRDSTNPYLTIVSMTLCNNDDHELNEVFYTMKKEFKESCTDTDANDRESMLMTLGIVLLNMGQIKLAKKIFLRSWKTFKETSRVVDAGRCCHYIGDVFRQKNHFTMSRLWYRRALEFYANTISDNHALIAKTYTSLGHAYSKTTDWKFSIWCQTDFANWWSTNLSRRWRKSLIPYNRALNIYKQIYGEEYPCSEIATCYLSLGSVYLNSLYFLQAIDNYHKALNIEEEILPQLHPARAYCHIKLGLCFFRINQKGLAEIHFEKAREIALKSLQPAHPLTIEVYYALGNIYSSKNDEERAKQYFEKQFELLNHPRRPNGTIVNVVEVADDKIHYMCPRCQLPVWIYPSCRIYKGKTCPRCIRELLRLRNRIHVVSAQLDVKIK